MILNMILAVLLSAFDSENLQKFDTDEKDERIERELQRFKRFFKRFVCFCSCWENLVCFKKKTTILPINHFDSSNFRTVDGFLNLF